MSLSSAFGFAAYRAVFSTAIRWADATSPVAAILATRAISHAEHPRTVAPIHSASDILFMGRTLSPSGIFLFFVPT